MVWGLLPIEPLAAAQSYYIFSKGTYKVGRKDCDVIIQTDRAISRLHAEIIVDTMSPDLSGGKPSSSKICIRDHSKFGTYINKEQSSKAVHSYPNKEKILKDGDMITFGTGNASFRFCFINLTVFVRCSMNFQADSSLQTIMSSIGATTTYKWSPECTHALADESSSVNCDLLDAIIEQKPVILGTWFKSFGTMERDPRRENDRTNIVMTKNFKILAEKSIRTEIPDCSLYAPSLVLNGVSVKIVDPKVREKCFEGYTFIVAPMHLYEFGNKLAAVLRSVGANVIQVDEFSKNIQSTAGGGKHQFAFVNPMKPTAKFSQFNQLDSLSRVSELELIIAAFSGHLEPSKLEARSILVSSSHSTDETFVADSQVEADTATSDHITNIKQEEAIKQETIDPAYHQKEVIPGSDIDISKGLTILSTRVHETGFTQRKYEDDDPAVLGSQNSDIIYSHDLIAKNFEVPHPVNTTTDVEVVNFKRFRKTAVESGNSFGSFIPFAKEPYREADFGGNDMMAYVREEKKRKQMEAIAEDLFNSAKAKKRGSAGASLLAFFSRS